MPNTVRKIKFACQLNQCVKYPPMNGPNAIGAAIAKPAAAKNRAFV